MFPYWSVPALYYLLIPVSLIVPVRIILHSKNDIVSAAGTCVLEKLFVSKRIS